MRRTSASVSSACATWSGNACSCSMIRAPCVVAQVPQAAEVQRQHRQRDALRGERLGRGDADFRARRAGRCRRRPPWRSMLPTTLQIASVMWPLRFISRSAASVSAVSPLCVIANTQRVVVERRIAIAQLAGVFHFDRNPGEFFDQILADQRRVPTRAAAGEHDAVAPSAVACGVRFKPPKCGRRFVDAQAGRASCCAASRAARRFP